MFSSFSKQIRDTVYSRLFLNWMHTEIHILIHRLRDYIWLSHNRRFDNLLMIISPKSSEFLVSGELIPAAMMKYPVIPLCRTSSCFVSGSSTSHSVYLPPLDLFLMFSCCRRVVYRSQKMTAARLCSRINNVLIYKQPVSVGESPGRRPQTDVNRRN